MNRKVINADMGDGLGVFDKSGNSDTRHRERRDLALQRFNSCRRIQLNEFAHQVTIKEVVSVFVCLQFHHHVVSDWVVQHGSGVAM